MTFACDRWDVLGIEPTNDQDAIKAAWKRRLKTAHPDRGGTREEYDQVQSAYDEARKEAAWAL